MHDLLQFQLLVSIRCMIPLFLFSNHVIDLRLLITQLVQFKLNITELLLNSRTLHSVVSDLACVGLEGSPQEELAIADTAGSPHLTDPLNLAKCQVFDIFQRLVLVSKHSQLVGAFFAGLVPTELAKNNLRSF